MKFKEPALDAKRGDIVQSRWSTSGAKWRVNDIYEDRHKRPCAELSSLTSLRKDTRRLQDLWIVESAADRAALAHPDTTPAEGIEGEDA